MRTDRAITATRPGPRRPAADARDGGFTVLEVMVAIGIIGTLMTALTPFLARSMVVVNDQRSLQATVEVANDAVERVRALDPSSLSSGRSDLATEAQWNAAPPEVQAYLANTQRDFDWQLPVNSVAGERAPLPTTPNRITTDNAVYEQRWYVGRCWQAAPTDRTQAVTAISECTAPETPQATVPFFRAVVSVTRVAPACDRERCIYVTATLVSAGGDPTFDLNRPPPTVADPGSQFGYVGDLVSLPLTAAGGWMPRTWTATGLPAGLALDPATGVISGTLTTAGPSTVVARVADRDGKTDDITFAWTVYARPTLVSPGNRTTYTGDPVSVSVPATGGRTPRTWTATGLPGGLTIGPSTGVITGTSLPAHQQAALPVTVTVTDAGGQTASVTFTWRVIVRLTATSPGDQTTQVGEQVSVAVPGTGGTAPLTWAVTGLPGGLSINSSTGVISGVSSPAQAQSAWRQVRVTVSSTDGQTSAVTFNWRVLTPPQINGLPSSYTDEINTNIGTVRPNATGGVTPYTWSARDLPDGVSISPSTGAITGTLRSGSRYITTIVVRDAAGATATATVVVTVTHDNSGDLRVTNPAPGNPDRTTALGAWVSLTADAAPGGGSQTWSATGLPPGLTITPAGVIRGNPTERGTWVTRLTVEKGNKEAHLMFTWRVT
ncbi:putative Ig domain-containing protein [Jidongwangia harbinensis]|uniref:putative Ig domain-containing protein n=1 Tax=Jidongwangia harbinensis TaxID=2878561 RepID=UPI001CD9A903|nr:putative Ig domain-containing protein [Jidongwangia harbinensis]MCA2215346.1 putative Ig domain-containing protein [Jidongwangia harbinensis]